MDAILILLMISYSILYYANFKNNKILKFISSIIIWILIILIIIIQYITKTI